MVETVTPPSGGSHRHPGGGGSSRGDKVRFALRGVGQTLITLGLVVLLFVVYEVWVTNWFSDRANHQLQTKILKQWKQGTDDPALPLPGGGAHTIKLGTGLGLLFLPRLGRDYHFAVVEGVDQDDLAKGPGHYPGTALPGQIGNFAVAGHRVGKGEPFLNLDKLQSGDPVVVETKTYWYVYRVLGAPAGRDPQGVQATVAKTPAGQPINLPGREIVKPSDGKVLFPVPNHDGVTATERLMTMTTCHPKFTATQRMIVYSEFDSKVPRTGNSMPASISALYNQVGA